MPTSPITDPTLGIVVDRAESAPAPTRLVSIGDSLTHGFGSGAVFHTDLSYSAIIAHELGWAGQRRPRYPGFGGLPLNIEYVMRDLADRFGTDFDWWEVPSALFRLRSVTDQIEDHWERGAGARVPVVRDPMHVLAVYGWDLRDALERTAGRALTEIRPPHDDLITQLVSDHGARAALRVLPNATATDRGMTLFDAAVALGEIETLVVFLGANNVLGAMTRLSVVWSEDGYQDLDRKGRFTVWRPEHFAAELDLVVEQVRRVTAQHVIWCTIPHVTIPPIARGVGDKPDGSRYFPYYTRPWIDDAEFDPARHPHVTGAQAAAVDDVVDTYNARNNETVAEARQAGRDWYLCDIASMLERLAVRRYTDAQARPAWWEPYPLPAALTRLDPVPDVRFLTTDDRGRRRTGGLFSLDGTHPTIVGYGLLAQELITVMETAGVVFRRPDGTARRSPVQVDMDRLVARDTLLTHPPGNLTSGLGIIGWADEAAGLFGSALPF